MLQVLDQEIAENTSDVATSSTNAQDYLLSDATRTVRCNSEPYIEDGSAVRFNPDMMADGTPYPFSMSGFWFIAVKRPLGHIDFFYVQ